MTRALSVVLSALIVLMAGSLFARARQQPVFRAGVPTVSIFATVVDPTGRLVPSLGQDDFEVFDNGKRQNLTVFANDVQPITLVMMLDRSQSVEQHFTLVRDAAEQFVTNLLPDDKVRLGSFSDRIQLDPETFTKDKDELIRILHHNLQDAGGTPLWNATSVAMTALGREEGRRVVLIFTDGHDDPPFATKSTNVRLGAVRERAAAEGVMVYAIGLSSSCEPARARVQSGTGEILYQRRPGGRGGTARPGAGRGGAGRGMPPRIPGLPRTPGRGGGLGPFGPLTPRGGDTFGGRRPSERAGGACVESKPDPDLRALTSDGGGGYFELKGTEDLAATFARIADELHHQYLLAFTVPTFDGKTHQLDVRVKQKNLTVRARQSYVAAVK